MTSLFKGHSVSCEAKGWGRNKCGSRETSQTDAGVQEKHDGGRKQSVGSGDDDKCLISKYILEIQPERPAGS